MLAASPQDPGAQASGAQNDAYTIFNQQLASILTQMQKAQSAGAANLGGAADTLTTEANTSQPYNPAMNPSQNISAIGGMPGAFAPAISSINTQLQNTNTGISNLGTEITGLETAYKPTALSSGQSLVTPGGHTVLQGHSYTPTVNPETGLVDGFDQNTGTWASQDNASGASSGSGTVGAIDAIFGASNPVGAYATDPNYTKEISGLYTTIAGLGVTQNADALQTYIDNNAKGAPVTGQMILNAASTYNIDPNLLTTVLLHESDFGTAGAAVKTMNPGNQGNTGTTTQAYNSWQQGVMATASNLANRIKGANLTAASSGSGTTPGATGSSTVGGTFSPAAAQKVSALPAQVQNYVQAGPAGVAYIDGTRVPDALQGSVQTLAAQAGIPFLAAGDVSAMQSIVQAQQNLNLMESTAKQVLGSGLVGFGKDLGATLANDATGGNAFPTFNQFNSYATEAINLIKGLAGGSGSGLRMTQSEIDTAQQNIPTSSDTLANAMKKVQVLQGLVYTRISSVFPDAQITVVSPQGQQYYLPASQYSDAIAQGYTTP